jgi:hypothetical protein
MSDPLNGPETGNAEIVPTRDPRTGQFQPGNPGGGRRKMPEAIRQILAAATPHAAERLVEALDATKVVHYLGEEVGEYVDNEMRTKAALAIFERLYGKTAQAIVTEDEDGNPTAAVGIVFLPTGPKP